MLMRSRDTTFEQMRNELAEAHATISRLRAIKDEAIEHVEAWLRRPDEARARMLTEDMIASYLQRQADTTTLGSFVRATYLGAAEAVRRRAYTTTSNGRETP